MRWLGRALAGSVAVHAAIAVAASQWRPRRPPIERITPAPGASDAIEVASAPPPAAVPIELIAFTPPPIIADAAPARPAAPGGTASPGRARGDRGAPPSIATGTQPIGPETNDQTSGARMLSMRDPIRRIDGASMGAAIDEIAAQGKPPPPIAISGRVAPNGDHARIDDLTFTATVEADGTVHIDDKPNFHAHIAVPKPKEIGQAIADWAEDPYAYQQRLGIPGDMIEQAPRGDRARITPTDQKPDSGQTVPLIGGGFDLTDWISRKALGKAKGDPYAARKLAALDATRDERVEMGRRHRNDQLEHADQIVRDSLDRLWASALPLADKKEALFELWDDCAETGDAPVVAAARRARNDIVGFIRAHLPAGGADAFTPDELDALNAHRTSKARFAPYDE